jgi:iron complex outermembrane receptor protein
MLGWFNVNAAQDSIESFNVVQFSGLGYQPDSIMLNKRGDHMLRNLMQPLLASVATLVLISPAYAQVAQDPGAEGGQPSEQIEDIVVTANKRAESVQNVSIAISAYSAESLENLGIKNSNDLASFTPNLTWSPAGGAGSNIGMRGVTDVNFTTSQVGSVGIIVDEVSLNSPVLNTFALFDLQRVEVLRGPQVTLYGRSTSGGAVNFITRRPVVGGEAEANSSFTFGNFNTIEFEGAVSLPLSDRLAIRVAGISQNRDGIFRNLTLGTRDSDRSRHAIRLGVAADIGSTGKLFLSGFYGVSRGQSLRYKAVGLRQPGLPNPSTDCLRSPGIGSGCTDVAGFADNANFNEVFSDNPNPLEDITAYGMTGNLSFDFGGVQLTSITSYINNRIARTGDEDGGSAPILDVHIDAKTKQFSQELRLTSVDSNAPFKWLVGAFFSDEKQLGVTAAVRRIAGLPTGLPAPFDRLPPVSFTATGYDQDNKIYSAYAQVDYNIVDKLSITLGARYSSETKSGSAERLRTFFNDTSRFPSVGTHIDLAMARQIADPAFYALVPYDRTWNNWGGKIGLNYKPNEDLLLYANVSRGFKGGTFNFAAAALFAGPPVAVAPPVAAPAFQRGVSPEKLTTYEIGFKSDLFDRSLQVNGAVFYNDYKNQQVFGFNADGVLVMRNAAASTAKGAELEIKWVPAAGWLVQAGGGYIDAHYDSFVLDDSVSPAVVADGNRLILTPDLNINGLIRKTWSVGASDVSIQFNALYTGKQYFEAENFEYTSEGARVVFDARLDWKFGDARQYGVAAWVKNLGDKRFCLNSGTLPFGQAQCSPNEPRTFGGTVSAKF